MEDRRRAKSRRGGVLEATVRFFKRAEISYVSRERLGEHRGEFFVD